MAIRRMAQDAYGAHSPVQLLDRQWHFARVFVTDGPNYGPESAPYAFDFAA